MAYTLSDAMKIIKDDFEGQYCNRNCISCSAFSLATARLFVVSCYLLGSVLTEITPFSLGSVFV